VVGRLTGMSYQPPEDVTTSKRVVLVLFGVVGILLGFVAAWFCISGLITQGHWLFIVGLIGGVAAVAAGGYFLRLGLRAQNSLR
jgi:hypothetical protein